MASLGDLVPCTTGGWMVIPPKFCPRGHQLGPNRMLVGHQPCAGLCGRGHMTWECMACYTTTYWPPLGAGCRLLDAAAFKR